MVGGTKTSIHDVITGAPLFPCLRSKIQVNASAAIPTLSGQHLLGETLSMLVIVVRCCSTCLAKGTSQTKEQANRYAVKTIMDLVLLEVVAKS